MTTNELYVVNHGLSKQAFEYMNKIRRHKQLCDVTLVADNIQIAAHKVVLASSSLYFHLKFVINRTGQSLIMKGVEGRILELLIDYIYSSKLTIEPQNVKDLLVASNLLMLEEVWKQCYEYLKDSLNPANCLEIADWADSHQILNLKTAAIDYIGLHLEDVIQSGEFLKASHQRFLLLLTSIKKKHVTTWSKTLMASILAWIGEDVETRKPHLDGLLEWVDMSSIAPKYLMQKLDDPLLKGNVQYIIKAMDVIKIHYLQDPNPLPSDDWSWSDIERSSVTCTSAIWSKTKYTSVAENGILMVAGRASCGYLSIEKYNFNSKEWTVIPLQSETPLNDGCSIIFDDTKIYVISGAVSDTVEVYDLVLKKWIPAGRFMGKRGHMGITTLDNRIYAVGGYSRKRKMVFDTAKLYSLENREWNSIRRMTTSRYCHGLGVLNNKIYAVGGGTPDDCSETVECYDPMENIWSPIQSMLKPRCFPGVTQLDDILYVIGGGSNIDDKEDVLKSVETYNAKTKCWSVNSELNVAREGAGVITFNKRIYVFGGENGTGFLNSVEMYDPKTRSWTFLPWMHVAKRDVAVTLMDSKSPITNWL